MSDSELAAATYAFDLHNWMSVSMTALSTFEFVTTFDQEIASVWKRKLSGATLLLFAVRYAMIGIAISRIVEFARLDTKECIGVSIANDVFVIIGDILPAAFSALRVYALRGGDTKLPATVLLLQLSPVAVNVYGCVKTVTLVDPTSGCVEVGEFTAKINEVLILASRIPLILGDILVVITTWIHSFHQVRMQRNLGIKYGLSTLMFRDGTVYFLLLLIINVLEISPLTATDGGTIIASLSANLSLILVNRFILNLRQLSSSETHSAGNIRTISMPVFRASVDIAGNMGESLKYGRDARDDEREAEEVPQDADNVGPSEHQSV